ncbi:MAG: sugar ABC transporter ATP-binding protein [Planctomycetes bacterium]|nr:sugar ABC transporter ATP-binding protein [Planctomycetota bacterium]
MSVRGLTRDFGAVRALDSVDVDFLAGEVHGVVGENGAGKSTLMNVLAGVVRPTAGGVFLRGEPVSLGGPADALARGIAMVHQELHLVDELCVAENVFLGRERTKRGLVDRRWAREETRRILETLGSGIDSRALVSRLGVADRQMVEIARALSCDARVLILDEPTAVLGPAEAAALFAVVRRFRDEGKTAILVSHFLGEVLGICDAVTVLRDGRLVETLRKEALAGTAERDLAARMVGRELGEHFPPRWRPEEETALEARGLSVEGWVEEASFSVRRGEILGLAGLVGAGRTELAEAVAGLRPRRAGTVLLGGEPAEIRCPRDAVRRGVAYLSEDRRRLGLVLGMNVVANTTLVSLDRYARPLLDRRAEREATLSHVRRLDIRVGQLRDGVETLSGGNQQKVSFAKWLETRPRVMLLDEPTRGIDVGAKEQIYRLIRELARGGMATVLISSEMTELLGMCDRIAVMRRGRIVAVVDGATATEEALIRHASGL